MVGCQVILLESGKEAGLSLPRYETSKAAGFDLQSCIDCTIDPGKVKLIPTGLTVSMQDNQELQVRSRSGLALKKGIFVLNAPGTVDADYEPNEIGVILANFSDEHFFINTGDRIAQAVIANVLRADNLECADQERKGGFGSTGV